MNNSREHILQTAFKLLLQKSYHEVTMQDIVQVSGMSKGAFYHYFNSKEAVFKEVVQHFFQESVHGNLSNIQSISLWEFCVQYINLLINRIAKYNAETGDSSGVLRANQYILIFDAMKMFPEFRDMQQKLQQQELETWTNVVAQARSKGEIASKMNDIQIAKQFIYLSYGIGAYHVLSSQIAELSTEVQNQFKNFYDSIIN
ncbi:TetR/AcrR family transcriptional regulator [Cellulophaga sp. BC115SP]|jgi:AcrR family transcriptional regulator|uniref:TetR/AcrR family transcriptional regulator n=1 Tax=Cellulophaga sp. BC115SP TaxID=2683263 RepID=UPI001411EF65|nr:TetR/AcrR family transcriptional regulator [Cellulophaga sp. BC115SP]NBB28808.1 TetR family transcriptional regulator [Cellulophaga sp. BC115SP]